jgi:HAD superfamily hydrolase (TIGR01509 family)
MEFGLRNKKSVTYIGDMEIWSQWVGTDITRFNQYDHLEESLGRKIDREKISQKRREKYEYLTRNETVRPGVSQYIKRAKELGLKVGLASSAPRDWVMENLTKLNLNEEFDCILVREDVKNVKPDPELYLQVLDYFNLQP